MRRKSSRTKQSYSPSSRSAKKISESFRANRWKGEKKKKLCTLRKPEAGYKKTGD